MDTHLLPYGLQNGILKHISEVSRGLECHCVCPSCKMRLIAKKGSQKIHHFAHANNATTCSTGYQTVIHLLAKEILQEEKCFLLPAHQIQIDLFTKKKLISYDVQKLSFDTVALEKQESDVIPDVILEKGNRKLFVEIYVTHKVSQEKLEKIKKLNVSIIEIDLSKIDRLIEKKYLKKILLNGTEEKKWLYNAKDMQKQKDILNQVEKFSFQKIYADKDAIIRDCPIHLKNTFVNKNVCLHCEYCYDCNEEFVKCYGGRNIPELFPTPIGERIKLSKNKKEDYKEKLRQGVCPKCNTRIIKFRGGEGEIYYKCLNGYEECNFRLIPKNDSVYLLPASITNGKVYPYAFYFLKDGKCPWCHTELIARNGKYGKFYSCSNFPKCRYKVNKQDEQFLPK